MCSRCLQVRERKLRECVQAMVAVLQCSELCMLPQAALASPTLTDASGPIGLKAR